MTSLKVFVFNTYPFGISQMVKGVNSMNQKIRVMSLEVWEIAMSTGKQSCIDFAAKVQSRNVLVSWRNKRNEEIAVMEKDGTVPKEWIETYRTILKSIEKEIERIDDTPECPIEEEK